MLSLIDMEKFYYSGLVFLNFAVLNILLSLIFFIISIAGKHIFSSPVLKSRLFCFSLIAPPLLSAFTIFTSFIPPLIVSKPGKYMICLSDHLCYIFSFISPKLPLFRELMLFSASLVFIALVYSISCLLSYYRACYAINGLSGTSPDNSHRSNKFIHKEIKELQRLYKIKVKVIDTPEMISFLWGYTSNTLVISTGVINTLSANELECLLLHELTHYKRRDNILKGIIVCCRNSLLIFPHVHYLFTWWKKEIELLGDEAAARGTGRPLDVASALIKMRLVPASTINNICGLHSTGFSLSPNNHLLKERVERLVRISDSNIDIDNKKFFIIPSEMALFNGMVFLLITVFFIIIGINPLLLHCYIEKLLSGA